MKYVVAYKYYGKEYSTGFGSNNKKEAIEIANWLNGKLVPEMYVKKGDDDGVERCVPAKMMN